MACLAKDMSANVLVAEQPLRVNCIQNPNVIVEFRIECAKDVRIEVVHLGPMWTAPVSPKDVLESFEY